MKEVDEKEEAYESQIPLENFLNAYEIFRQQEPEFKGGALIDIYMVKFADSARMKQDIAQSKEENEFKRKIIEKLKGKLSQEEKLKLDQKQALEALLKTEIPAYKQKLPCFRVDPSLVMQVVYAGLERQQSIQDS